MGRISDFYEKSTYMLDNNIEWQNCEVKYLLENEQTGELYLLASDNNETAIEFRLRDGNFDYYNVPEWDYNFDYYLYNYFENGFDMRRKFICEGKEVLYANNVLTWMDCVFHGPEAIKTLKYILSFVESPDELYDTGGWPIVLEYKSNGVIDYFDMELPRYGCCQYKAARIVERFIIKKGWKEFFDSPKEDITEDE